MELSVLKKNSIYTHGHVSNKENTSHKNCSKSFKQTYCLVLNNNRLSYLTIFLTSFTLIQNPEAVVNGFVYQTFKYMCTLTGHV